MRFMAHHSAPFISSRSKSIPLHKHAYKNPTHWIIQQKKIHTLFRLSLIEMASHFNASAICIPMVHKVPFFICSALLVVCRVLVVAFNHLTFRTQLFSILHPFHLISLLHILWKRARVRAHKYPLQCVSTRFFYLYVKPFDYKFTYAAASY